METKSIPLCHIHKSLGAKMISFSGFEMPLRYSSDKEEHFTVRERVGVFDVSHMGEFIVKGEGALDLIQKVTSNDASEVVQGQAQYSCMPNETGGIIDDLIVYCLSDQEYMLVVNASNIEKDWAWIQSKNEQHIQVEDISEDIVLLAVQGPKSSETLQKLTDEDLSEIGFYRFKKCILSDIEMMVSGTGYTGSGGFELYIPKKHGELVWNAIFEEGKEFDIKPIGLGARDTLRLEQGYCLYGKDITDETSPLEAGLGWITKFTKEFTNCDYLSKQKKEGVQRKLIGFKMLDKGIPRSEYEIMDKHGECIGFVTSGALSPSLGVGIGMGYVQDIFSKTGTEVFVQVRNKQLRAKVVKPPFL